MHVSSVAFVRYDPALHVPHWEFDAVVHVSSPTPVQLAMAVHAPHDCVSDVPLPAHALPVLYWPTAQAYDAPPLPHAAHSWVSEEPLPEQALPLLYWPAAQLYDAPPLPHTVHVSTVAFVRYEPALHVPHCESRAVVHESWPAPVQLAMAVHALHDCVSEVPLPVHALPLLYWPTAQP